MLRKYVASEKSSQVIDTEVEFVGLGERVATRSTMAKRTM